MRYPLDVTGNRNVYYNDSGVEGLLMNLTTRHSLNVKREICLKCFRNIRVDRSGQLYAHTINVTQKTVCPNSGEKNLNA